MFGYQYPQLVSYSSVSSLAQFSVILHSSATDSVQKTISPSYELFLLGFAGIFANNISDSMLILFPEFKLCGFRWFCANLAARVDGIKPIV